MYPKTDDFLCVNCTLCEKVCPVINQNIERKPENVYAVKNKNEFIRESSSSGGFFLLLGEKVIENKGVVFGAKYTNDWEVVHDYAENAKDLIPLQGSKYVQSRVNGSFVEVESFLKKGRQVLFTGTPCQIAGLKLFLKKKYDNLITIDFICHGVPSPLVFKLYLNEIKKNICDEIKEINMRDKKSGWKNYSFTIVGSINGSLIKKSEVLNDNIYRRGFLSDIYLRPSCHKCPSKNFKSGSDITIGDYWGIDTIHPEFYDNKGISLVCIHKKIMALDSLNCFFIQSDIDKAKKYNKYISVSAKPSVYRDIFFREIHSYSIIDLIKKYSNDSKLKKLKKLFFKIRKYWRI